MAGLILIAGGCCISVMSQPSAQIPTPNLGTNSYAASSMRNLIWGVIEPWLQYASRAPESNWLRWDQMIWVEVAAHEPTANRGTAFVSSIIFLTFVTDFVTQRRLSTGENCPLSMSTCDSSTSLQKPQAAESVRVSAHA